MSYIKIAYGNQLVRDFSEMISDKNRYINLMVKLLRDEINTFYYLRHYESIQKYITRYFENTNSNYINFEESSLKEALELFKDDFGLRKMEILKEIEDPNIKVFFNIGRFDQQKAMID